MQLNKTFRWFIIFSAAFFLAPLFSTLAADVIKPSAETGNVVIFDQESHKNLYTAGSNVVINGNIAGDITAAGGNVTVKGNTEQEVLIAGSQLNLSGSIGSNAKLAGGTINVTGSVGGDLAVVGSEIYLGSKASVSGDLLVAGGTVIIEAPISGDIRAVAGNLQINNKVNGNIFARAGQVSFGPNAEILGTVNYSAPESAQISEGAKLGKVNFTKAESKDFGKRFAALFTFAFLVKLLAWMLAAWVVLRFKKNYVLELTKDFQIKPWHNLGFGLLVLVLAPLAIILLFITLIGYYVALLATLIYIFLIIFTNLLASLVLGYFILSKLNKPNEVPRDWQAIVIGVVGWFLLAIIPIIGWLIIVIFFLMVFGAKMRKLKAHHKT